jgi:putative Mg2+ transporter-C (MgtC) family protein
MSFEIAVPLVIPATVPLASAPAAADAALELGEIALRLSLAALAAAVVGWDRERQRRPAGLRTHMLVGIGACLFTLLAMDGYERLGRATGTDPLRVIEGIVGGVGFLGAGSILHSRGGVKGLTTAAGIWVVAAIGVAAALGSYATLALALVLVGLTLTVIARVERAVIHGTTNGAGGGTGGPRADERDEGDDGERDGGARDDEKDGREERDQREPHRDR